MYIETMFENKVRNLIDLLKNSDLEPSPKTNKIFSDLVNLATDNSNALKFSNSNITKQELNELRKLCSEGEYKLEMYWSQRVIESDYPEVEIMRFPYYENYRRLSAMEFMSLKSVCSVYPKKMLIIGGGPLPLSGILASQEYGINVDYLDISEQAIVQSNNLSSRLKLNSKSILADAYSFDSYADYDTVLLAALVGWNGQQKAEILKVISKQLIGKSAVIVRTAEGARRLLYPDFNSTLFPAALKEVIHVIPKNDVVNSFKIALKDDDISKVKLKIITKTEDSILFMQKALQYINSVYGYDYKPEWHYDLDNAHSIYTKKGNAHWLVVVGGNVIGTAAVRKSKQDPKVAELWRFFIDRQPEDIIEISKSLIPEIESFAKSNGYNKITVHDQKHVPGAVTHYLHLGFTVTADKGDEYDTVYMEKAL
jgi:nicotianamine synthase